LPEKEIYISKKELEFYKKASPDENLLRTVFGFKKEEKQNYGHFIVSTMNKNVCNEDELFNSRLIQTPLQVNSIIFLN